jgi:hypothetical protein
MDPIKNPNHLTYVITFQGRLDERWQNWFAGFNISTERDLCGNWQTILTGTVIDQAALRGLLNKLWNLNLSLISIYRLE